MLPTRGDLSALNGVVRVDPGTVQFQTSDFFGKVLKLGKQAVGGRAGERLKPFEFCPGPAQGGGEQYLLNFDRGDHMIFAGRYAAALAKTPRELAERYHQHIRIATLAFLDAHLRGDGEALRWLQSPQGLAARLGADAQLRMKTASDAASAPSDASPLDRSPSPAAGGASATAPALP